MISRKSLHIEIRVGERITIDSGRIVIELIEKSGRRARLRFDAEHDTGIDPVRERPIEGINRCDFAGEALKV